MRIGRLLLHLSESGYSGVEFVGDRDQDFDGFAARSSREDVEARCFFLIDEHWPEPRRRIGGLPPEAALGVLRSARMNGAAAFAISRDSYSLEIARELEGSSVFITDDSHEFCFEAGRAIRMLSRACRLTLITGSVGKTSTTAMIAHALRSLGFSVAATKRSQNVSFAVVRNLTQAENCQHAVLEVSHGACRDFMEWDYSVEAEVSVVTAVAEAHLETIGTLEDVARLKSTVFADPPPAGTAVINLDTSHSDILLARAYQSGRQVITYGESEDAAIRLVAFDTATRLATAQIGRRLLTYRIGVDGKHMAINSLAVIGALRAHGIAQWEEGVRSLESYAPISGRGDLLRVTMPGGKNVVMINDAYNANPASIRSSIETLSSRSVAGRKVAVLGDMLELGAYAAEVHRSLTATIASADLDLVVLFGPNMAELATELGRIGFPHRYLPSIDELKYALPGMLKDGDEVLVKASNATGLSAWIRQLVRTDLP